MKEKFLPQNFQGKIISSHLAYGSAVVPIQNSTTTGRQFRHATPNILYVRGEFFLTTFSHTAILRPQIRGIVIRPGRETSRLITTPARIPSKKNFKECSAHRDCSGATLLVPRDRFFFFAYEIRRRRSTVFSHQPGSSRSSESDGAALSQSTVAMFWARRLGYTCCCAPHAVPAN